MRACWRRYPEHRHRLSIAHTPSWIRRVYDRLVKLSFWALDLVQIHPLETKKNVPDQGVEFNAINVV